MGQIGLNSLCLAKKITFHEIIYGAVEPALATNESFSVSLLTFSRPSPPGPSTMSAAVQFVSTGEFTTAMHP